jgi:ubiquinone/menaquinone biosynthesis C-methylase UbiE
MTDFQSYYDDYWSGCDDDDLRVMTSQWLTAKLLSQIPPDLSLETVLDVGGGRGTLLGLLHQAHRFERMWGVDLAFKAIDQAKKSIPNTEFALPDAEYLPFRDSSADLIVMCDLLEHVPNPSDVLAEALRIGSFVLLKVPAEGAIFEAHEPPAWSTVWA